jgi:Ca-activated chloride channel homolog
MTFSPAGMFSTMMPRSDDAPGGSDRGRSPSGGAELIAATGKGFSFKRASVAVEAAGGMARVVLEQEFENPNDSVLDVIYRMPLPDDAAVAGYSFEIEGRRIHGEIDTKKQARARYTEARAAGHTAGLLESQRSNIFTQEIANIPPRKSIVVRIKLEQKLIFLPEGLWEFRFPTVIGPRYLGAREEHAAEVGVTVASAPIMARMLLDLRVSDALPEGESLSSSTHQLRVRHATGGRSLEAGFEEGAGARLDRDIVVRWKVATRAVGLSIVTGRPEAKKAHSRSAYGLLTVTPPEPGAFAVTPRDLMVLIDTSGSMQGPNLAQAKQAVLSLLDTLTEADRFELLEFSNSVSRYELVPTFATASAKKHAAHWVKSLQAGGCTEMYTALRDALSQIRPGSQRQVLVLTDGYIGNETEIVQYLDVQRPKGCRLHVIGIGSAVNRALTQPLARAGRGLETLLDDSVDVVRQIQPLARRMALPILTDIEITGDALIEHAPANLPDVFQGAPLLAPVKLKPEGGILHVKGMTASGTWTDTIEIPSQSAGTGEPMAVTLYAREAVQDLETRWAMSSEQTTIDNEIESIGLVFQIVTRKTSFIAIDSENTHERGRYQHDDVPQELPSGMRMQAPRAMGAPAPMAMSYEPVRSAPMSPMRQSSMPRQSAMPAPSRPSAPGAVRPAASMPSPPPAAPRYVPPAESPMMYSIPYPAASDDLSDDQADEEARTRVSSPQAKTPVMGTAPVVQASVSSPVMQPSVALPSTVMQPSVPVLSPVIQPSVLHQTLPDVPKPAAGDLEIEVKRLRRAVLVLILFILFLAAALVYFMLRNTG